jgi:hypothetical protein
MARNPKRLGLTRDQLASFLSDFEQIKQFEQLFSSVDQINNFSIDEVSIAADNAGASANDALAQISFIAQETQLLALAPPDLGGTVTSVGLSTGSTGLTVAGPNPITTSGTFTLGGTLSVANGGTGTSTAFTQGSIVFAGASGVYSQDNANLNWDDTNNTLGVGRTASANVRIYAKGGTTGSGAFQFYGENSAATGCFGVRDDGAFFTGLAALSPYNLTTAAAANLVVGSDGYLYRSTATSGSGTVTSVDVSGGTTGLTTSGGPITTSGTITIGGTLAVASGGTGATTASGARTNLGAAASGANSDITSMSGITGAISSPTYIQFGSGSGTTLAAGRMWYNQTNGTLNFGMGGGNITQQVGEELFRYGKASAAITDSPLQLVYKTGAVGASGVITFAPAVAGIVDSDQIIGCATEDIPLNGFGRVTTYGVVNGINTTGSSVGETWTDNTDLYYNPLTGGLTKNVPVAPGIKVLIGTVINAGSGGSGSFVVKLGVGASLNRLADVQLTSPANNDLLQYYAAGPWWRNVASSSISIGTATNLAGGAANRIPYQTGAGATGFIVAPTSANTFLEWSGSAFQWSSNPLGTVTSVSVVSANGLAGTVATATTTPAITLSTTVTGIVKGNGTALSAASAGTDYVAPGAITTSGLTMATARLLGRTTASSGAVEEITIGTGLSLSAGSLSNSAPDQTVSITGAGTTVVTGTYPNFTITSNDQFVGTVTSVGGTGSVNGITLTGTVTSSGSLTLGGTLSNVSLTTQVTGTLPVGNGGTGTATAFTTGSIVFANSSGIYAQDNANFNWNNTNKTLGVGRTASSNVRVYSKGGTTGSGAFSYYGENSAGTGCFGIRDDGAFYTGAASLSPYNLTTAAAANLVVAADYYLYRSTSSARYKKNIVDYDRGLAAVRKLRAVYYEGKGEIDAGQRFAGFVAEEVYDSGLTEFVVLDEEGKPDALHYGNMTALLASAIKELGERLKRIEAALGIEDGDNS